MAKQFGRLFCLAQKRSPSWQYLYWNGWKRFFSWFDHKSWYPLGRPVGTTIYPGMQFTAVWINRYVLPSWSLNDVCVYIPAWFGVVATLMTGLVTYECSISRNSSDTLWTWLCSIVSSSSKEATDDEQGADDRTGASKRDDGEQCSPAMECAVVSMGIMSIVPAHLMRSMGGGYDNESVAVFAMVSTFYWWVRSLRSDSGSYLYAIIAALSYGYMVAAWGGYVFVLNLIGLHAAVLVLLGRFDWNIWASYSLFYCIGTMLATLVPVVGWVPLKSLEQLGALAVFLVYQLLFACEQVAKSRKLTKTQTMMFRVQVLTVATVVGAVLCFALAPTGYFGPVSSRVRGLFVKHTKTGNPLVDSVAEHQPASILAYFQYLHQACTLAPLGFIYTFFFGLSNASTFVLVWAAVAYFFSLKMVRLILLTAPIASILGGIAGGRLICWSARQWWKDASSLPASNEVNSKATKDKKKSHDSFEGKSAFGGAASTVLRTKEGAMMKRIAAVLIVLVLFLIGSGFYDYCWRISYDLAHPSIILKARTREGEEVTVDDYREAYWWLRDNTPQDSRILAWWDYGYQISAIANRTTIADGNTWNHEHIALLGKALTTDLDKGWDIARHLADYVLLWTGGGGDDLAKSPHLARIANSVYRDHCPDDPTCRAFGFLNQEPSAMMQRSLLYNLHSHKYRKDAVVPEDKFEEVYSSKYGKVRIYKVIGVDEESKAWSSNPTNRLCDSQGSWFCPGQYPPGLSAVLSQKKDFSQFEDFNKRKDKRGDEDDGYTKKYFEDLQNPDKATKTVLAREKKQGALNTEKDVMDRDGPLQEKIKKIYSTWEDTEDTTKMWQLISTNNVEDLKKWLDSEPQKAFIRSKDGRGPMFWAFEQRNDEITKLLMRAGVPHTDKDARGQTPVDILEAEASV